MNKDELFNDGFIKVLKAKREGKCIIPIQEEGNNIPFFVLPGFFFYQRLSVYLSKEQPFYCIEPLPFNSIEDIASYYLQEIRLIQPNGPYCLGAFCGHGKIVLEMAHQLIAQQETVSQLIFFEYYSPEARLLKSSFEYLRKQIKYYLKKIAPLPYKQKVGFVFKEVYRISFSTLKGVKNDKRSVYSLKPYQGRVVLFKGTFSGPRFNQHIAQMGWSNYFTGDLELIEIEGDHNSIFEEPNVVKLAEKLNDILQTNNKQMFT